MSSVYQGAIQAQTFQGALQVQAGSATVTPADTVTITDAISLEATKVLGDSVTPADAAASTATKVLGDSVTPADAAASTATKVLGDSVTPTDAAALSATESVEDSITPVDQVALEAEKVLTDTVATTDQALVGGLVDVEDRVLVHDTGFEVYASPDGNLNYYYRDNVDFPESAITTDFTIDYWCKPSDLSGGRGIVAKWNPSGSNMMWMWSSNNARGMLYISDDGSTYTLKATVADLFVVNQWQHIAISFDVSEGSANVYRNGSLFETLTGYPTSIAAKTPFFTIAFWGGKYIGGIANVKLFKDIRSPAEILASAQDRNIDVSADPNCVGQFLFNDAAASNWITNSVVANADLIPRDQAVADKTFGEIGRTEGHGASTTFSATKQLADTITPGDAAETSATKELSDSVAPVDAPATTATEAVSDTVTPTDSASLQATIAPADTVTPVDVFTGTLTPGILDPVGEVASEALPPSIKRPAQRRRTMSNFAIPITSLTTSSAVTTYTKTRLTDSAPWDLSEVEVGDQVATEDGYVGLIISTGANQVEVQGWIKDGVNRMGRAADKPLDNQRATVYRRITARSVLLFADPANTHDVYVGFDSGVLPVTGHPINRYANSPNSSLRITSKGRRPLNLSDIWVVSGMPQAIRWQTDSRIAGFDNAGHGVSPSLVRPRDAITPVDSPSTSATKELSDSVTVVEGPGPAGPALSASVSLSDVVTVTDVFTGVLIPGGIGPYPCPELNDVVVDGNYAYVTIGGSGAVGALLVFDVTNKAAPVRAAYMTFASSRWGYKIAKLDQYLYVTTKQGLIKVDVSTPTAPLEVGFVDLTANFSGMGVGTVVVDAPNRHAYICTRLFGLKIVNIDTMTQVVNNFNTEVTGLIAVYDTHVGGSYNLYYPESYAYPDQWAHPNGTLFQGCQWCVIDGNDLYLGDTNVWKLDRSGGVNAMTVQTVWTVVLSPSVWGDAWRSPLQLYGGSIHLHVAHPSITPAYQFQILNPVTNDIDSNIALTSGLRGTDWSRSFIFNWSGSDVILFNQLSGYNVVRISPLGEINYVAITGRGFDKNGDYVYATIYQVGNYRMEIYDISDPTSWVLTGTAN